MKSIYYILIAILPFVATATYGQNPKALYAVSKQDSGSEQKAIIYGNFVQRLGFSSGGFAQDIRIMNNDTKEVLSFRVKPTFKSAKENVFCFYIKPGKYTVVNYWWTESKWYGGKMFTEYIYKNIESSKVADKLKTAQVQQTDLEQYAFDIDSDSAFYLGTWHFDKELVSFSNDKGELDKVMQSEYPKINWTRAKIEIPQ